MSNSLKDYDDFGSGGFSDAGDHSSFSYWTEWLDSFSDLDLESYDRGDGYDDHNEYFKESISARKKKQDAEDYFENHKKDFIGKRWKPRKFFQKMYLRHILKKTRAFIDDLDKLDLSETSRKTTLREKIRKAVRIIKKAEKKYEIDHSECLILVAEAMELGKKVMEEFKYLDVHGGLDD